MLRSVSVLVALALTTQLQGAQNEADLWQLEKSYWEYVKANDLEKYRALWHENFLGWPYVSSTPVRKDQITDWITANTSKGIIFDRAARDSDYRQRRDQLLSNHCEMGEQRRSRSQDRSNSNYSHMAAYRHKVADHWRHVGASEFRRQVVTDRLPLDFRSCRL
jgi:hypothetical protein